jgi:hypothetical protein
MTRRHNKIWRKTPQYDSCLPPILPKEKFITAKSKVCAMGSCFADEMGWWLRSKGINVGSHDEVKELQHLLYRWGTFFNPKNLSDCLEKTIDKAWDTEDKHFAYIEKEDSFFNLFMKIRANSNDLEIVKRKLIEVENYWRNWLEESDVVIITLGLIEAWIDKSNGKAWQAFVGNTVSGKSYHDLAKFHVLTYEECLVEVRKSVDLINKFGKDKQFIITLSPIPLEFTFRNEDIITANRISKSTLRVVADQICRDYENVYYFPSFEIVMDCIGPKAFKEDLRHVRPEVFSEIIAPLFLKSFGKV